MIKMVVHRIWLLGILIGTITVVLSIPISSYAATLSVSPATGVYQSGATFTVQIGVNTQGKKVNAADGTVKFNPQELQVVTVNRANSIFNFWTTEPTFSNTAGTVTFSAGSPAGYTGAFGNVMTVTFRVIAAGTARVNIINGSVLASDGMGTNVLTTMNGGTYTLTPISTQPSPEVVIEYVPPPNTPAAPVITSTTHGESGTWSNKNSAELRWTLPAGVSAVRTLLDTSPSSVPTKVYDTPISSITLNDLADGISYFHLQFQNADGWGRIGRYRFAVDTKPLPIFTVQRDETIDQTNPIQTVLVTFPEHTGAPITRYEYTINGGDVIVVDDSEQKRQFTLPALAPGNYTIVVTAFNAAGSSALSTYNFSIKTFSAPRIENIPERINERTLPVIQGVSAPGATVTLTLTKGNAEPRRFVAIADENGAYSVIVDEALTRGVYTVTLSAVDANGAESDVSNPRQLIVEEPGYMTIGSYMVNVLSVVLSLVSLTVMTLLVALYGMRTFARFRKRVGKEAAEMLIIMQKEFKNVQRVLAEEAELVVRSRKTKQLTKAEQHLIDTVNAVLVTAEKNITKEATDVANLVDKDTIS